MTSKEMREARNKLLVDAQKIMSGDKVTTEQRTQADKMLTEANELKAQYELRDRLDAETSTTSGRSIPRGAPGADEPEGDTRSLKVRRRATDKALRAWMSRENFETRDLTVAANGAVMIPVGVTDPKIAMMSAGSIYDLVYKLRTGTGEAIKAPMLNDVTNLFVLNSASITTTDPATGGVTIQIDDIRSNPILIERSLIQDAGFDLVGFVERAVQSRYLRTVSKWITQGNGSNVVGTQTLTQGVVGNTTLVLKYIDMAALFSALDPAYLIGAVWVMSNATLGLVLNILDTAGRPIFLPYNDGANSGFVGTIFGYPVKLNPYQPSIGVNNAFIQFGNFEQGYTFREVDPYADVPADTKVADTGVVTLRRLDERYAELNKVGFVGFARVGGQITIAGNVPSAATSPAAIVTLLGK